MHDLSDASAGSSSLIAQLGAANDGLPELADLVKAMSGYSSTNGWDVICSYSVAQLNDFLQAQYDAGKLARSLALNTAFNIPFTDEIADVTFNLSFASPKLQFIAGNYSAVLLEMPIIDPSNYVTTRTGAPSVTTTIPGGLYSAVSVVPLASVSGDGVISSTERVITFSEGGADAGHVVLHFKSSTGGVHFELRPPPDPARDSLFATWLVSLLNNYFTTKVPEFDYALASVNNEKPASGDVVLTPKSFAFAAFASAGGGVLSLYIQLEGSGNPQGDAAPVFQPGGRGNLPVPSGYTASLILSYDLITRTFLAPQLKNDGFDVSFPAAGEGILVQLRSGQAVVAPVNTSNGFWEYHNFGGLSITFNDVPLTLLIKDGGSSIWHSGSNARESSATLFWQGTATSSWSHAIPVTRSRSWGVVDLTITLGKGSVPLGQLDQEHLAIANFNLTASDFSVAVSAHTCTFLDTTSGCSEIWPAYYNAGPNGMALQIPAISLAVPNLNFFATTNLLAPGQHIIDFDTAVGVRVPHDFLLVGNVKKTN